MLSVLTRRSHLGRRPSCGGKYSVRVFMFSELEGCR